MTIVVAPVGMVTVPEAPPVVKSLVTGENVEAAFTQAIVAEPAID
jgi:hypothetical protein